MVKFLSDFWDTAWFLFKDLWYWALVGVFLSRIMSRYLSTDTFKQKMLKNGPVSLFFATIAGAVLPLCACGVIPFLVSFMRIGVPLGIIMAFTAASPLMDPADFMITAGTLGWDWAIVKTISAFAMGLVVGGIILFQNSRGKWLDQVKVKVADSDEEVAATAEVQLAKPTVWVRIKDELSNLWFSSKFLLLAIVLGALLNTLVPQDVVQAVLGGNHWYSIWLASLIGHLTYGISSVPFVKILVNMGMSKGAGMAFLIAGHATSVGLLVTLYTLVRRRVFWMFLTVTFLISVAFGYIFNAM